MLDIDRLLELSDKRLEYCRNMKPCPKCGTDQVQLVAWIDQADWKCRQCKKEWSTK